MRRLGVLGAVPLFKGGPGIEFTVPLLTVPLGLCGSGGVCVARHCGNGAPTNGAPHFCAARERCAARDTLFCVLLFNVRLGNIRKGPWN